MAKVELSSMVELTRFEDNFSKSQKHRQQYCLCFGRLTSAAPGVVKGSDRNNARDTEEESQEEGSRAKSQRGLSYSVMLH